MAVGLGVVARPERHVVQDVVPEPLRLALAAPDPAPVAGRGVAPEPPDDVRLRELRVAVGDREDAPRVAPAAARAGDEGRAPRDDRLGERLPHHRLLEGIPGEEPAQRRGPVGRPRQPHPGVVVEIALGQNHLRPARHRDEHRQERPPLAAELPQRHDRVDLLEARVEAVLALAPGAVGDRQPADGALREAEDGLLAPDADLAVDGGRQPVGDGVVPGPEGEGEAVAELDLELVVPVHHRAPAHWHRHRQPQVGGTAPHPADLRRPAQGGTVIELEADRRGKEHGPAATGGRPAHGVGELDGDDGEAVGRAQLVALGLRGRPGGGEGEQRGERQGHGQHGTLRSGHPGPGGLRAQAGRRTPPAEGLLR